MRSTHDRIHESVDHYRKAVRGKKRAFAALKGYTGQLLRADRAFDAALLSSRYLTRFLEDDQSIVACARAIEAWLELGNSKAAGNVARQWLAAHDLAALAKEYDLDASWVDSYVWIAKALHEDRDGKGLERFTDRLWKINEKSRSKLWARGYGHLIYGWRHHTTGWDEGTKSEFARFGDAHWPRSKPRDGQDLLLDNWRLRLEWAATKKDSNTIQTVLDEWVVARPKDPEPRLMRARRLIDAGRGRMALGDLENVIPGEATPAQKDEALELMLAARDHEYAANGQDSRSLLQQLVAAPESTIVIPAPIMHYGIAKLAAEVATRDGRIAPEMANLVRRHAREAAEAFPWSNTIRVLRARFAETDDALYHLSQVLARQPNHLEARRLEIEILREHEPTSQRLRKAELELVRRHPRDIDAAMLLGDALLARGAYADALTLANGSEAASTSARRLEWIRGRALLGLKQADAAVSALERVPQSSPERVDALGLALRTIARIGPSARLPKLRKLFLQAGPEAEDLRAVADDLAQHGHLSEALETLRRIHEDAEFREARNGELYILLGKLRYSLGQSAEAQSDWDAAISKADGASAIPLLALSLVYEGEIDEAKLVLKEAPEPQGDDRLIAYLWHLLGERDKARARLKRFTSKSRLLPKILDLALDAVENGDKAEPKTPFAFINDIVTKQPKEVLTALCLPGAIAFDARANEALAAITASVEAKRPDVAAVLDSFRAWQDVLSGRVLKAAAKFAGIVHREALFLPAYDEMIWISEVANRRESMIEADMLARYWRLSQVLPPEILISKGQYARFPAIWMRGVAQEFLKKGDEEKGKVMAQLALLASPKDPEPLRILVEHAEKNQRFVEAIRDQLRIVGLLDGPGRRSELSRALTLALRALDNCSDKPSVDLRAQLEALSKAAGDGRPSREGAPGLGLAAVLAVRLQALSDANANSSKARAQRARVLETMLEPYVIGKASAREDAEGVSLAAQSFAKLAEPEAAAKLLDSVLERDPSLLGVWRARARLHLDNSDVRAAIESLSWIASLVPGDRISIQKLAGLLGQHAGKRWPELENRVTQLLRDDEAAAVGRALLALRRGDLDKCIAEFDAATGADARPLTDREIYLRAACRVLIGGEDDVEAAREELRELTERLAPMELALDLAKQLEEPELDVDAKKSKARGGKKSKGEGDKENGGNSAKPPGQRD